MKIKTRKFSVIALMVAVMIAFFGAIINYENSNEVYAEEGSAITFTGEGTVDSPYLLTNQDDLFAFAKSVNDGNGYAGKFVKLTADVDLENKEWTPIGTSSVPFLGMFDGGNNIIKNLKISWSKEYVSGGSNQNYAGLFGYMKGGNTAGIKNLTIENAEVSGCLYVGVILGRSYTGGIIENCHVKGQISVDAYSYAGIIVGRHEYSTGKNVNGDSMSMYNCSVEGTNKKATVNCDYAVSYAGGIVGFLAEGGYIFSDLSVKNVEVKGTYGLGGISGIGHYGNKFLNVSVSSSDVISINNNPESDRTGNVGQIVGACQGTEKEQTVFKNFTTSDTNASVNGNITEEIFGSNMNGSAPITNFVAKVNGQYFESMGEAVANLGDEEKIVLLKNTQETVTLPAGVKLESNGFEAESVVLTPLQIEEITTSRNDEDNATILTITYLNSDKVTTIVIPDGKDGANGVNGKDGKDGKDGIDGKDGANGIDGINGTNGTNGIDGKDGKDANGVVGTLGLIFGITSIIANVVLVVLMKKKAN